MILETAFRSLFLQTTVEILENGKSLQYRSVLQSAN